MPGKQAKVLTGPQIQEVFDHVRGRKDHLRSRVIIALSFYAGLVLTSRVTKHPVPVVIKGASSGGKSNVLQAVLRFFPQSASTAFTSMSDKALLYWDEPLEHRF